MMLKSIIILLLCCSCISVLGLSNLLNSRTHNCIRCICHAVSGCYMLKNCAKYSMTLEYWTTAGSPVVQEGDPINENSYKKCMQNDNCIIHTINDYTASSKDCNCDGDVNCEDRLANHFGKCGNPMEIANYATVKTRYQSCSGEAMSDPICS